MTEVVRATLESYNPTSRIISHGFYTVNDTDGRYAEEPELSNDGQMDFHLAIKP